MKIHGDISTDPSRTRVVFDERTNAGLTSIAALVVTLLEEGLSGNALPYTTGMIAALVPTSDPRMVGFQRRSFKTELFVAIQRCAKGRFDDLRLRPTWLNVFDFETLSGTAGIKIVPHNVEGFDGIQSLLRFLGAKEATFNELSPSLYTSSVTVPGAAELVGQLTQRHATKQIDSTQVKRDWRLWPVGGKVLSFEQAKSAARPLDRDFADLLLEKSRAGAEAHRLIAAISDDATARALLPVDLATPNVLANVQASPLAAGEIPQNGAQGQRLSLKRWRSAEQQVLSLLAALGWTVEDVSRQNAGYDIEGRTPDGEEAFIEVKSIDYPGQPFTLTSNEEAVARQKGSQYQLAIVRQSGDFLEVVFIRDPIQHLKLTRQCRQWVWECGEYPFNPQRFSLE